MTPDQQKATGSMQRGMPDFGADGGLPSDLSGFGKKK